MLPPILAPVCDYWKRGDGLTGKCLERQYIVLNKTLVGDKVFDTPQGLLKKGNTGTILRHF
jgi:hypothetical protein